MAVDGGDGNYVRRALELFARYGGREAIVSGDQRLSHDDLRAGVLGMASALLAHGVRPGTAIGILVTNPYEAILLQLGAHLLGCRTAWIMPDEPASHRVDFLRRAAVDTFVYDARTVTPDDADLPTLCLGPGGFGPDLLAAAVSRPGLGSSSVDLPVPASPQTVLHTGGTTGRPKLVHHRHDFFRTLFALSQDYLTAGEPRLRHLAASRLNHVSGQVSTMMTLFTGGTWLPCEEFEVEEFLHTIEKERVTSIYVTPPQLYQLLDHPLLDTTDTSSLHMVSVGGSATAPARLAQAIARLGPVLRPVYGSTEAAFIAALPKLGSDPSHARLLSSCGQPYGDSRIEIRTGRGPVLSQGEAGEVWVTGGLTMHAYWADPELTRECVVDGWVRTGDVGYLDPAGHLFLVDRVTDMIVVALGTDKVYPRPIEDALLGDPQVRAAAVIGVPDQVYGEAVHAFVVPAPGADITAEGLRRLVIAELNETWCPRDIEFVEALPLTGVGKVDKKALRARFLARSPAVPS